MFQDDSQEATTNGYKYKQQRKNNTKDNISLLIFSFLFIKKFIHKKKKIKELNINGIGLIAKDNVSDKIIIDIPIFSMIKSFFINNE
ncbi:hypothetical protein ACIJYB_02755 [Candidatus Pelagibacter bacterium nBUS_44]|uniref:hypothetical protein n=1 Tax=Candidatus Pelagibacter bacterium nBUS_44 TaxID=3374195 RepID=UPI003EC13470